MINEKIIEIRQKNKLSQSEFGKSLGVTQFVIGRIERNQQDVDLKMLRELAEHFDVNLQWLIMDEIVEQVDESEIIELKTEIRILREMLQLPVLKNKKRNISWVLKKKIKIN